MDQIDPVLAGYLVVGISVVVWLLMLIYTKVLHQDKPSKVVLQAIAFVAAVVLAWFFTPITLPSFSGDPIGFAVALLAVAVLLFKSAQKFYDWILQHLLDAISGKGTGLLGFLHY